MNDLHPLSDSFESTFEWLDEQWTLEKRAAELRALSYPDYLKTDWWQAVRQQALKLAGERCQLCNQARGRLDGHHRCYENMGLPAELDDVIILCARCHARYHKGSRR